MGLINLQTDLKSLKYGRDRKRGGDSGQPYVKKDIPSNTDELDNALKYGTGGPDMLLRGGLLTPLKVVDDVTRFSKFFIDFKSPRGLLFIAQQNLLSRLAVKTEASWGVAYGGGNLGFENNEIVGTGPINEGIYLPTSTLLQIAGNAFGVHLNKQGIDPTGLLGDLSIKNYYDIVNRQLLPPGGADPDEKIKINRLYKLLKGKILTKDLSPDLYSYGGGPGSTLGIGKTNIKIIDGFQRTGENNVHGQEIIEKTYQTDFYKASQRIAPTREENNAKFKIVSVQKEFTANYKKFLDTLKSSIANGGNTIVSSPQSDNYSPANTIPYGPISSYGQEGIGQFDENGNNFIGLNPVNVTAEKPKIYNDRITQLREEQLNIESDLYKYTTANKASKNNDIIDFYISILSNEDNQSTFYYFPAYIENFNDGFTADWKSYKFLGRAENFYTYSGFDRSISLSFKTYARNINALSGMYSNLNEIASSLAPTYVNGFMSGNISKLTLGNYIIDAPGIITNFKFDQIISDNSTWDIDFQLPTLFNVSMEFKVIHNFIPQYRTQLFGYNYNVNDHPYTKATTPTQ